MIIHAPHIKLSFAELPDKSVSSDATYLIARPGDGTVICGGTFQSNVWDTSIDSKTARGIYERVCSFVPELRGAPILTHNAGLRPAREGGPRVELETIQLPLQNELTPRHGRDAVAPRELKVVHAYGFGPAGYQNSWGAAMEVREMVEQCAGK